MQKIRYDYKKLCVDRRGLLPCKYEEDREDLYFYYDIERMSPFQDIKVESREKKYQVLINFLLAERATDRFLF